MRTELNERGSQFRDHVVSSRTMRSESCLPFAAEQCDLEKGFIVSEPVPLGIKLVGQTLFNRHAYICKWKGPSFLTNSSFWFCSYKVWHGACHLLSSLGFAKKDIERFSYCSDEQQRKILKGSDEQFWQLLNHEGREKRGPGLRARSQCHALICGFLWVILLNGHTSPVSRCYHPIL